MGLHTARKSIDSKICRTSMEMSSRTEKCRKHVENGCEKCSKNIAIGFGWRQGGLVFLEFMAILRKYFSPRKPNPADLVVVT